jgi:hypothetical protein
MLNLVTFDIADRRLLEKSYDAIRNKELVEIITAESERRELFLQTVSTVKTPYNSQFSFQNVLKVKCANGYFYIAQCLVDFGYPRGPKGSQSFNHEYNFQIVGIANMKISLGVTHLRAETKIDKIVGRFFNDDINFVESDKFNGKYYLVSDNKPAVMKYFNEEFLNAIAKYDNILLTTNGTEMYISFDTDLQVDQSRIVQEILSNFKYLAE